MLDMNQKRLIIMTVNGTKKHSMPIFQVTIESMDGKAHEEIELTGLKLAKKTGHEQTET